MNIAKVNLIDGYNLIGTLGLEVEESEEFYINIHFGDWFNDQPIPFRILVMNTVIEAIEEQIKNYNPGVENENVRAN